jgi:hypothetical protein
MLLQALTGIPISHFESPQIARYLGGQYYRVHDDAFALRDASARVQVCERAFRHMSLCVYVRVRVGVRVLVVCVCACVVRRHSSHGVLLLPSRLPLSLSFCSPSTVGSAARRC